MKLKLAAATAALTFSALTALPVQAQTEIQWWHAMSGALGEWVNDLAKDFNASQKDYKVVPVFKGTYDEAMTAAVAAFRAGNAPVADGERGYEGAVPSVSEGGRVGEELESGAG